MKKLSTAALALSAVIAAAPVTTHAAGYTYINSVYGQDSQNSCYGNVLQSRNLQKLQESCYNDILNSLKEYSNNCKIYVYGGNGSNCPEPNTPEPAPEVTQPEAAKPEVTQPEAAKPEVTQPEAAKPEPNTPEPAPEAPKSDAAKDTEKETSLEQQVLKLVNQERKKAGLKALVMNEKAQQAAEVRAKEIQTSFSHTRPNGTSFSTALKESGVSYRGAGENIAWGQTTPEKVMEAWMNSPGHKANILNKNFTAMGVGHAKKASTNYWTQLFLY